MAKNKNTALDRIDRRIAALERERVRIESLPGEPVVDGDETPVIYFRKTFNGIRNYDYAAIKVSNGLWYTTGPSSPKGYSWDELVEFITQGEEVQIYVATEWTEI